MDERTLRAHQIELVVDAREDLRNCSGVADHAHCPHDLGKVTTRHNGWWLVVEPHLKPVGDQSTNWIVRFVLIVATAAFTSLGTTSPRYIKQQAMYLPWRGSHLTIIEAGSKQEFVISATDSCSW